MPKFIKSPLNLFFAILALLFLYSCGLWSDFTTYFNTYYNAQETFEKVEEQIEEEDTELFAFREQTAPRSVMDQLKKVLEKTSKIMQFDTASSYFDDALFMSGKAFYYQGRYAKALRKFRELEALKESDIQLENQLWIGKTELQVRNFDRGMEILNELETKARERERPRIATEALISQISFLVYRERFSDAVEAAQKLIKVSEDDELNANVAYEMGNFYLQLENFEEAKKAFRNVQNYSPSFLIEYQSQLEYARIQRGLGEYEEGLEQLEELRGEAKYKEFYPEIEYEIGMVHYDQNNIDQAFKKFKEIDSLYTQSKVIGKADYKIAQIFENHYMKYDSADHYYDLVLKSEIPQDIRNDAQSKTKVFDKYFKERKTLIKESTNYLYATDSSAFIEDSLAYVEYMEDKRAEEALSIEDSTITDSSKVDSTQLASKEKEKQEEEDQKIVRRGGRRDIEDNEKSDANDEEEDTMEKPVYPTLPADSISAKLGRTSYKLGNLFFAELNVPDSARFYYEKSLDHNLSAKMRAKVLYALGNVYETMDKQEKADSLYNYVYTNYKSFDVVNEAAKKLGKEEVKMLTDKAQNMYLEAEDNLWDENYDSAITQFYAVYDKFPKSTFAPKALYTIGYIYENNLSNYDSAATVYDTLTTKYTDTKYAREVRPKVDAYKQEQQKLQAVQDSIARADSMTQVQQTQSDTAQTNESDTTQASASEELEGESSREKNVEKESPKIPVNKPDTTTQTSKESPAEQEKNLKKKEPAKQSEPVKNDTTNTEKDKNPPSG